MPSRLPHTISAKKMTPQERKEMERAGKKHKNKKKLWVSVNDKGSKTKRGGWAGNATFQWQGDEEKHAEEIPLRTGDHLKLQGKELWVHPKKGEPFQYAGKKDEDEKKPANEDEEAAKPDEGADDTEPKDEEDFFDEEKANDEKAKAKNKKKKKPKPEEDDQDEEDNFDDEEGAGALTDEEIAADDEEEAIAAEEEKLALRKKALKADKMARAAKREADKARDALAQKGIGTKLKTQVEDEGVDKTAKDLADKVVKLAGKQSLPSFLKSLLFLGLGIKSGGESIKKLGPSLRAELEARRKQLEAKNDDEDIIDAEFSVVDNLKALDNPKLLTSGPLAPAEDADIDSILELQKKHKIGLADAKLMHQRLVKQKKDEEAAAAAKAAKPPPLPKKKSAFAGMPPEKIDSIKAKVKPNFSWKDSTEEEEGEELDRAAEDAGLDSKAVRSAFKNAKKSKLDDDVWEKLENTDSWETTSVKSLAEKADEYGRDWRRVVDGLTTGAEMPRSIVLKKPDGTYTLVGGNTRLMAMRALGIKPEVMVVDMAKPKKTKKPPMEDNEGIPSVSELQKKHGIGYGPATRMQEKLRKERDENLPMAKDEDVVAASLRRVKAALKRVQAR